MIRARLVTDDTKPTGSFIVRICVMPSTANFIHPAICQAMFRMMFTCFGGWFPTCLIVKTQLVHFGLLKWSKMRFCPYLLIEWVNHKDHKGTKFEKETSKYHRLSYVLTRFPKTCGAGVTLGVPGPASHGSSWLLCHGGWGTAFTMGEIIHEPFINLGKFHHDLTSRPHYYHG